MMLSDATLPEPDQRIIEVGPPDPQLYEFFRDRGRDKYLGLLVPGAGFDSSTLTDADARHFVPIGSADEAKNNNADLLILNGRFGRYLWYRRLGLARNVAFPAGGLASLEPAVAARAHRRRSRRETWAGREYRVVEMAGPDRPQARHYTSQLVGIDALPGVLDATDARYAVLRWFEQLPKLDEGEDLDVLVADGDLEAFTAALEEQPGTIAVDVYSTTGRPGADFQTMAYFPPARAGELLERAVRHSSGYLVPAPPDHFASLAYHAVYHKGPASGLPIANAPAAGDEVPEHDYAAVLAALGARIGADAPLTMEGLDEYLAGVGWRPPRDMLARLSHHNEWVRARFFADATAWSEPPLLAAFLLRERASNAAAIAQAESVLRSRGFEILEIHRLDAEDRARCAAEIRGGNWGQGPFPLSGGEPAVLIVAVHDHPKAPSPSQRREHPGLANAHTLEAKLEFRDELMSTIPAGEQFNPLHSSDSDEDAWHYVELAHPEALSDLRALVEVRRRRRELTGASADAATTAPRAQRPSLRAAATQAWASVRSVLSRVSGRARNAAANLVRWGIAKRASGAAS
jgi:hypothetical protein